MATVKYGSEIKNGWLHFPDQYCTLAYAADFLGITRARLEKLIENDMVVWDQPKNKTQKCVEMKSLHRLKQPENEPVYEPLAIPDGRALGNEIDAARHRIAAAANLPPGAVKICFDLDE